MKKYLPILTWLPQYKKSQLSGDLMAGLTVGVMLIPQGMAYAMIAGLPPVYGLYAAMVPQVIYAIFGTSRQLAVGPVAMDSLLVAAGVSTMAAVGSENYITLAIMLAFLMGLIQLIFGIVRLGFLVNFLSKPVISGFTAAAALIIGLNQLKHLIGVDISRSNFVFNIVAEAIARFSEINVWAVVLGIVGIILIKTTKRINRAIPGALVVVVLSILAVRFGGLANYGVKIVGEVPTGVPAFTWPNFDLATIQDLFPIATTLALIAFMEAISVAKAIQSKHKGEYQLDANQELIALGLSNIVGSLFSSYPTTGGFSRSAVNDQAGAKTNLAALVSATLIGLTLLFLTPLFYHLPKTVLASIIMVAVFGLIDFKYPRFLWKNMSQDFFMFAATFLITLLVGIKEGIIAGVIISLLIMIYRSAKPHMAVLGHLPGTSDYRNVERFEEIQERPDVLAIRYDAQLYFANTQHFIDSIKCHIQRKGSELRLVVMHCGSMSYIDATAFQALSELVEELAKQGIQVYFSGLIGPVRDFFKKSRFVNVVGHDNFFLDVYSAIQYFDDQGERDPIRFRYALQNNVFEEDEV
ncbi:MAG: SulP family inorganic anion transporter [Flammeovirgaceae bacterium]